VVIEALGEAQHLGLRYYIPSIRTTARIISVRLIGSGAPYLAG
ncbi:MAG: hypothetical protein JWN58_2490, partial [Gammaproteobacteria bacterium]|nr:hypothetical protein [Gammaproteobacteria bacterium]